MSLPPIPDSSYVKHFDGMLWMAYTPKDMQAYGQQCREQALEDASQAVLPFGKRGQVMADLIRSLK